MCATITQNEGTTTTSVFKSISLDSLPSFSVLFVCSFLRPPVWITLSAPPRSTMDGLATSLLSWLDRTLATRPKPNSHSSIDAVGVGLNYHVYIAVRSPRKSSFSIVPFPPSSPPRCEPFPPLTDHPLPTQPNLQPQDQHTTISRSTQQG